MDDKLVSLEKLFNQSLFRIPDYQRGYSWEETQLEEFWDDIMNIPEGNDHYTGMLSLREITIRDFKKDESKWNDISWLSEAGDYGFYYVVDGQQRLTTFVILINEIIRFVSELPENKGKGEDEVYIGRRKIEKLRETYIYTADPETNGKVKAYKFGYEDGNPSYEYFKRIILETDVKTEIEKTFYTLNLQRAKEFFSKRIEENYKQNNKSLDGIVEILNRLTSRLKFNIHYIKDDFNVFVAFETMNNRGKRLSCLELLKNRLIYLTTLTNDKDNRKNELRREINDTWRDIYRDLGRNEKNPLDDDEFLRAHWIIYFGYSRNKGEGYNDFLLKQFFTQKHVFSSDAGDLIIEDDSADDEFNAIDDSENESIEDEHYVEKSFLEKSKRLKKKLTLDDIEEYINSLRETIPFWYALHYPDNSIIKEASLMRRLESFNRLGTSYFKPLVCVALMNERLSTEQKVLLLEKVERWTFIYFCLCTYPQNFGDTRFYGKAFELYHNQVSINDILDELEKIDVLAEDKTLPSERFMTRVTKLKNNRGFYRWSPIRSVLYEYELSLRDLCGATDIKLPPDVLFKKSEKDVISVEHIYPQTDSEGWNEDFNVYSSRQKELLKNSLGNLLPLSQAINSSFQNESFVIKKNGGGNGKEKRERGYKDGCYCERVVANKHKWTPEHILERGLEIVDFMERRWDFKFSSKADKKKFLFFDDIEGK